MWDLSLMIDYYECQYNFFLVSTLMIAYFSRTCFRPCWDYIDAYDYMNMIEALGLDHLTKKPKPNAYYH